MWEETCAGTVLTGELQPERLQPISRFPELSCCEAAALTTAHIEFFILFFLIYGTLSFFPPFFVSVWLPVPVPQAAADLEPADLDRVQRGFVPVILSAAL